MLHAPLGCLSGLRVRHIGESGLGCRLGAACGVPQQQGRLGAVLGHGCAFRQQGLQLALCHVVVDAVAHKAHSRRTGHHNDGTAAAGAAALNRLANACRNESVPESFQTFVDGIPTLTKTERRIFEGYVAGLRSREIVEQLDIKDSTLRYHNRNIYDKLGVTSLKELLQYVAILNSGGGLPDAWPEFDTSPDLDPEQERED